MIYFAPAVSALVTLSLIAYLLSSGLGNRIQDLPNERSLHSLPIPRVGGIGLLAGILAGFSMVYASLVWWLLLPLALLFVVSLLDDIHGLPVRQRLAAHFSAAAALVLGSGFAAEYGVVLALFVLLLTVWMTNLYNFMDGSDGLAGGMTLFGFAGYGIAAWFVQDEALAILNLTIAAAALGFLFFNFHPAKIFMGDAGAIPLGFLAAGMGIWGWQRGVWGLWFPLLVFSPFIVDATVTLGKRTARGVKITEAHREHYYQRMIQMGTGHREVALFEYALMLLSGALALCWLEQVFPWRGLLVWCAVYAAILWAVDRRWNRSGREAT